MCLEVFCVAGIIRRDLFFFNSSALSGNVETAAEMLSALQFIRLYFLDCPLAYQEVDEQKSPCKRSDVPPLISPYGNFIGIRS